MQTYDDILGVEVFGLSGARVEIDESLAPDMSDAVRAKWSELTAHNTRMYDGPILSVTSVDAEFGVIHAARDRYARLAVHPSVRTGVRLLSVTAMLVARDAGGLSHVFFGRRGAQVARYPGMWEIGPSGGLAVPAPNIREIGMSFIANHLRDEIEEEIGVDASAFVMRPIAYVRDHNVMSDDIVLRVECACTIEELAPRIDWEYSETRWVPEDCAASFASERDVIVTTRALARFLSETA
jgi:hypothetical protein